MKVIILTGTIGSGKSAASGILKELGAAIIDSDSLGKEVVKPGNSGWKAVVDTFGKDVLAPDNTIDRKKLAGIVFGNPDKLQKLNSIIHPRVDDAVEGWLRKYQEQGVKAVFVEMAILVEARWMKRVDEVWVVKTNREKALKRLMVRNLSESEVLARMAAQSPPEEKVDTARVRLQLINNDGSLEDLKVQLKKLWKML